MKKFILILFLATYIVYLPSLFNNFVYDDYIVILNDEANLSLSGLVNIFSTEHYPFLPYYRPIVRLTFVLQKALFGTGSAFTYHLVNIFIAGLLGSVVYKLLNKHFKLSNLLSLLGGLLVIVHPVTSSSVYPAASGRETLLPVLLATISLYLYLSRNRKRYIYSVIFYALALFGKEQMIVLPFVFVITDLLKINTEAKVSFKDIIKKQLPMIVVTVIYLLIRLNIFKGHELSFTDNGLLVVASPFYAFQQFISPFIELHYEPMSVASWFSLPRMIIAFVALGAIFIAHIKFSLNKNLVFFLLLFVLIALLPNANILRQDAYFDERYLLLSLIPFVGLVTTAISHFEKNKYVQYALMAIIVLFGIISFTRGKYFKDNLAFSTQWVKTSPEQYLPYYNLGRTYEELQQYDLALENYTKSTEINNAFSSNYLNLGTVYLAKERYEDALTNFFVYQNLEPDSPAGFYHAGLVYLYTEAPDSAINAFNTAIEKDPELVQAYNNLGVAYELIGDIPKAIEQYKKALEIDPAFQSSQNNINRLNE